MNAAMMALYWLGYLNRGAIQRYFHDLDAAAQQYYSLSSPVTLSGDFEISIDFSTSSSDATQILFGGSPFVDIYISVLQTNRFDVWVSGVNYVNFNVGSSITDGVEHTVNMRLNGSSLTVIYDGQSIGTSAVTPYTAPFSPLIGNSSGFTGYFTGTIPSLKIWTGGDRTTGTLTHHWEFDTDLTSPTIPDLAGSNNATAINMTSADAELFTLNTATTPDQWENSNKTRIIQIAGTP